MQEWEGRTVDGLGKKLWPGDGRPWPEQEGEGTTILLIPSSALFNNKQMEH
jgi:hypothetical protein